jgi:signal peptidase II
VTEDASLSSAEPQGDVPRDELPTLDAPTDAPGAAPPPGESDAASEPDDDTAGDLGSRDKIPPSYLFFAVVAGIAAILDLASKEWAAHALAGFDIAKGAQKQIDVIAGVFDLQYAQNPGGAWSMLRSLPEIWRRPFFLFVSTSASVFITSLYGRIDRRDFAMRWGLPLALGGAVGNLVDRVRHGYVVDFLHFFYERPGKAYHWPTFNVADVWIVVGVGMMAFSLFFGRAGRRDGAHD